MALAELERDIEGWVDASRANPIITSVAETGVIQIIKYMPARHLTGALASQQLYASERAGFTWGDAVYVTAVRYPRSTMMYGQVGVVGEFDANTARFYDAVDAIGVRLYQQWIVHQTGPYLELTTTVHAQLANRTLRNAFRTRFQIDCVFFRPDETCPNYVDVSADIWFALTHWNTARIVGCGYSDVAKRLQWCVVGPDFFEAEGRGYNASIHRTLSVNHKYVQGHYSTLEANLKSAYAASDTVVICDYE